MIKKVVLMVSVSFVIGCSIALLTPFFFVYEFEEMTMIDHTMNPDMIAMRPYYGKVFPLIWYYDYRLGGFSWWLSRLRGDYEILAGNLLWDIAFHTFATLGIMGILVIESKKSKLREYDLVTP